MSELLTRARSHIAQMAPHQRDRTQGQLLMELADEVERLQGMLSADAEPQEGWCGHCACRFCHEQQKKRDGEEIQ